MSSASLSLKYTPVDIVGIASEGDAVSQESRTPCWTVCTRFVRTSHGLGTLRGISVAVER